MGFNKAFKGLVLCIKITAVCAVSHTEGKVDDAGRPGCDVASWYSTFRTKVSVSRMTATRSFHISVTSSPATQRKVPEDQHPQRHYCEGF